LAFADRGYCLGGVKGYNKRDMWPKRLVRLALFFLVLAVGYRFLFSSTPKKNISSKNKNVLGKWVEEKEEDLPLPVRSFEEKASNWLREKSEAVIEKVDFQKDEEERKEEAVEEIKKTLEKIPQEQLGKIKEEIVKQVFPDCQCRCYFDEE